LLVLLQVVGHCDLNKFASGKEGGGYCSGVAGKRGEACLNYDPSLHGGKVGGRGQYASRMMGA